MDENKSNENKNKKAWLVRATTSIRANFLFILQEKTYFFLFYTSTFTKDPYQFIYSTHLFNKIFIIFTFFLLFRFLWNKLTNSSSPSSHTHTQPTTLQQNPSTKSVEPHPHPASHRLLRQATDPTQTQNHPHPATNHHQQSNRTHPLESLMFIKSRTWNAGSWSTEKASRFHVIEDERG